MRLPVMTCPWAEPQPADYRTVSVGGCQFARSRLEVLLGDIRQLLPAGGLVMGNAKFPE
jgi:hypothetical protein